MAMRNFRTRGPLTDQVVTDLAGEVGVQISKTASAETTAPSRDEVARQVHDARARAFARHTGKVAEVNVNSDFEKKAMEIAKGLAGQKTMDMLRDIGAYTAKVNVTGVDRLVVKRAGIFERKIPNVQYGDAVVEVSAPVFMGKTAQAWVPIREGKVQPPVELLFEGTGYPFTPEGWQELVKTCVAKNSEPVLTPQMREVVVREYTEEFPGGYYRSIGKTAAAFELAQELRRAGVLTAEQRNLPDFGHAIEVLPWSQENIQAINAIVPKYCQTSAPPKSGDMPDSAGGEHVEEIFDDEQSARARQAELSKQNTSVAVSNEGGKFKLRYKSAQNAMWYGEMERKALELVKAGTSIEDAIAQVVDISRPSGAATAAQLRSTLRKAVIDATGQDPTLKRSADEAAAKNDAASKDEPSFIRRKREEAVAKQDRSPKPSPNKADDDPTLKRSADEGGPQVPRAEGNKPAKAGPDGKKEVNGPDGNQTETMGEGSRAPSEGTRPDDAAYVHGGNESKEGPGVPRAEGDKPAAAGPDGRKDVKGPGGSQTQTMGDGSSTSKPTGEGTPSEFLTREKKDGGESGKVEQYFTRTSQTEQTCAMCKGKQIAKMGSMNSCRTCGYEWKDENGENNVPFDMSRVSAARGTKKEPENYTGKPKKQSEGKGYADPDPKSSAPKASKDGLKKGTDPLGKKHVEGESAKKDLGKADPQRKLDPNDTSHQCRSPKSAQVSNRDKERQIAEERAAVNGYAQAIAESKSEKDKKRYKEIKKDEEDHVREIGELKTSACPMCRTEGAANKRCSTCGFEKEATLPYHATVTCPICASKAKPLSGTKLRCAKGHTFDVSEVGSQYSYKENGDEPAETEVETETRARVACTEKEKRRIQHIQESEEAKGVPPGKAEQIANATVKKRKKKK